MKAQKILMICGDFSEDYEVAIPFHALKMLGYEVNAGCPDRDASSTVATCIHDINDKYQTVTEWEGHRFNLNISLNNVESDDYCALILPGGRACEYLRNYPVVKSLTSHFIKKKKPVAAICRGTQILMATGLMKGRTLTGNSCVEAEVLLGGATYLKKSFEEVVVDGNIVTATEWHGTYRWLQAFVELLGAKISI
ncbi:MAG: DJ-1/PfpI family protein [Lentisphaerae bacterium]|nr:DJ-1/PfpI family protein [Lentisphaerota bacterium]MCP4102358.1 DJ-1/PfpI family protein [Lentisphaerota bacterium]